MSRDYIADDGHVNSHSGVSIPYERMEVSDENSRQHEFFRAHRGNDGKNRYDRLDSSHDNVSREIGDDEDMLVSVENLDEFFHDIYNYYYEHGFATIVARGLINSVSLGFTIAFSSFLIGYVDWGLLLTCDSEDSCKDFLDYVSSLSRHSIGFQIFMHVYILLLTFYWCWTLRELIIRIAKAYRIYQYVTHRLHISTRELQTMQWFELVDKLIEVQDKGVYPIQINGSSFTAKDVAMRIMRKQNYLIAMINEHVLPVGTIFLGDHWYFGRNLEMMLEFAVLNHIFDSNFKLQPRFLRGREAMKKRFQTLGFVALVLLPFSIGFFVIFSFLKYAQEWHSKRSYLGPRWWTNYSLWKFREYNEMPHIFERRTSAAVRYAVHYVGQFPSPLPTAVFEGISFVTGAIVGVLMLFTLLDESILLYIKVDGRALVWYIAIFSAIVAVSRSFVTSEENRRPIFNPSESMRRVASFSHFLPQHWRFFSHTYDVRDEFCEYFSYRVVLLLREFFAILTAPYVLWFVLPDHCDRIIDFVASHTLTLPGIGDVCVYSTLDLMTYGDAGLGTAIASQDVDSISDQESMDSEADGGDANSFVNIPRCLTTDGKLEKSWLNFKLNYPTWTDRHDLIKILQDFQKEMLERCAENKGLHSRYEGVDREFPSMFNSMTESASVAAEFARGIDSQYDLNQEAIRQQEPPATVDLFSSPGNPVVQPLGAFRYPNQEDYFFWLEVYRDKIFKPGN